MPRFCTAPDPRHRLAVLGVFTAEENLARREAARTWIRGTAEAPGALAKPLLAKFVARGLGETPTLAREAHSHGDIILLPGLADMPRSNGPLLTLILWLECALVAWPHAALIGKADDDVWVHTDATAAHLQGSLRALRTQMRLTEVDVPHMYWGLMETYSWSLTSHRPMGFQYKFGSGQPTCVVQNKSNHTLVGPVHFAKGPMYFVSAPLIAQLVADPSVQAYTMTVIASANYSAGSRHKVLPWEDVFTGLALTRTVAGVNAAYVHMGSRVAGESYGIYSKMGFGHNTILFHANTKSSRSMDRYVAMHRWALEHHCDPGLAARAATLRCEMTELTSCTGVKWKRCLYVHNYTACPQSGPRWKAGQSLGAHFQQLKLELGSPDSSGRNRTVERIRNRTSRHAMGLGRGHVKV